MKSRIIVFVATVATLAAAQVPMADFLGEEVRWVNARMLASGGVQSMEPGPSAVFANPAFLGFAPRPSAELTFGLKVASEQRTRIVYDQFENSLGEIAIAENTRGSGVPGPLSGVYPIGHLAIGAGIAPVRDFNYSYLKEYRDDFYVKVGEDRVEQTGMLYNAGVGVAYRLMDWLSAGARGGYVFGSRSYQSWKVRGVDTTLVEDSGKPGSIGFGAGMVAEPVQRLAIAADYSAGMEMKDWSSREIALPPEWTMPDYTGHYPWSARLGISFRAPGTLPSTVSAEAKYLAWNGVDTTFSNLLVVRAGVEHTLLNFVSLRYGFGVEPQPFDPTLQRINAGFGLGFDAGIAHIDVGALLTHDVIGPYNFSEQLAETDLRVYENRSYFAVTVSRSF